MLQLLDFSNLQVTTNDDALLIGDKTYSKKVV